jgi:hypothetical protein
MAMRHPIGGVLLVGRELVGITFSEVQAEASLNDVGIAY